MKQKRNLCKASCITNHVLGHSFPSAMTTVAKLPMINFRSRCRSFRRSKSRRAKATTRGFLKAATFESHCRACFKKINKSWPIKQFLQFLHPEKSWFELLVEEFCHVLLATKQWGLKGNSQGLWRCRRLDTWFMMLPWTYQLKWSSKSNDPVSANPNNLQTHHVATWHQQHGHQRSSTTRWTVSDQYFPEASGFILLSPQCQGQPWSQDACKDGMKNPRFLRKKTGPVFVWVRANTKATSSLQ